MDKAAKGIKSKSKLKSERSMVKRKSIEKAITSKVPSKEVTLEVKEEVKEVVQLESKEVVLPEWDSETVRNADLMTDGFTACVVMIMEDSPELTKYNAYIAKGVETGTRKKFRCIHGDQVAERVKAYMVTTGQLDSVAPDQSYMDRQDLFAEAIKFSMMNIKYQFSNDQNVDTVSKELEMAGARSKEFVRRLPHITMSLSKRPSTAPPAPPPTSEDDNGIHRTMMTKDRMSNAAKTEAKGTGPSLAGGTSATATEIGMNASPNEQIGVKTRMRKRGELPIPELQEIDDAPHKGPQSYIILLGFYNPRVIDELRKIGVNIDGILLLTDEKVNRYNFSIIDVEDSIPGTFRPRNVLPEYLKRMDMVFNTPEMQNGVTKFWSVLSEMYNLAPADSPFHDIAFMNFYIPDATRLPADSPDFHTYYSSLMFDEMAQRIYEMLVLGEWFQEFTSTADVHELQPLEPTLAHEVYDQIIGHIPAECITIPIILEAILEQVSSTLEKDENKDHCDDDEDEDEDEDVQRKSNFGIATNESLFGDSGWGLVSKDDIPGLPRANFGPSLLKIPLYIKAGDNASIRCCHLRETLAAKVASCQLSGDIRNIQGFLWKEVPEFNPGLQAKLQANLNHFMYFMPPEDVKFEDMFYILHLLLSAGIEIHLQKESEARRLKKALPNAGAAAAGEQVFQNRPHEGNRFPGTNLDMDNNYLAVNPVSGVHFVIAPNSQHGVTITGFGKPTGEGRIKWEKKSEEPSQTESLLVADDTLTGEESTNEMQTETEQPSNKESNTEEGGKPLTKKQKKQKAKQKKVEAEASKTARISVTNAIENAAEIARKIKDEDRSDRGSSHKRKKKKKSKKETDADADAGSEAREVSPDVTSPGPTSGGDVSEGRKSINASRKSGGGDAPLAPVEETFVEAETISVPLAVSAKPSEKKKTMPLIEVERLNPEQSTIPIPSSKTRKRFIACEEEWFEDINDASVIQTLLECPALLAISESGALDLSKWVEKYLFSCGLDIGGESTGAGSAGVLLGDLKNWNYIEEMAPIQTIQLLNQASHEYLSMHRMYCPFYDTLLFIFNNPMPEELAAETQSYFRLKTLPGLQHFLEYAMTDDDVLRWVETLDSSKRLDAGEQTNINALLDFIPDEQWLLEPSIKYQLQVEGTPLVMAVPDILVSPDKFPKTSGSPSKASHGTNSTKSFALSEGSLGLNLQESKEENVPLPEATAPKAAPPEQAPPEAEPPELEKRKTTSKKLVDETKSIFKTDLNFTCYNLGKRVAVVGNDAFYAFPVDGTVIRYDISTIEPEFRLMQLSVSKNGHQTFFYPYYVPHDFDLSTEGYVVCPYFHMVLANGTLFAFQDLRAEEAAPYLIGSLREKHDFAHQTDLFSFERVLFGKEVEQKITRKGSRQSRGSKGSNKSAGAVSGGGKVTKLLNAQRAAEDENNNREKRISSGSGEEAQAQPEQPETEVKEEGSPENVEILETEPKKKGKKGKDEEKDKKKGKEKEKVKDTDERKKSGSEDGKKEAKDAGKKGKKGKGEPTSVSPTEEEEEEYTSIEEPTPPPPPPSTIDDDGAPHGDWMYPEEDSEDEEDKKRRLFFVPPWDQAEILIYPMTHHFKVSLPSGLTVHVEDLQGPPVTRVIKQSYVGFGSARSHIESSRYYTMEGTVVKFLFDGTIQILTARGVTTNIDELAANAKRDTDDIHFAFDSSSVVKIFNGEVILPNGNLWDVVNGRRVAKDPIYVFTTGPLMGGEIFRRRQDGVIYLHRHDGTVITHYPDGTRFTTRMVILEKDSEDEFSDWVFVGLKYMVEHPNYCTVLFNTLTGNSHLKLPQGEWVRVFADGGVRIATTDDYKLDVDKHRALLNSPSSLGEKGVPNITAVRLWHDGLPPKFPVNVGAEKSAPVVEEPPPPPPPEPTPLIEEAVEEEKGKKKKAGKIQSKNKMKQKSVIKVKVNGKKNNKATRLSGMQIENEEEESDPLPKKESLRATPTLQQILFPPPLTESGPFPLQEEPSLEGKKSLRNSNDATPPPNELAEFLSFKDDHTFCKAIDSWNNRFAMDIYGVTIVDKMEMEESKEEATNELLEALSEHTNFPKRYLSGLLQKTSSDHLNTAAKRFQAFKRSLDANTGSLTKTKVFVVKRDLTGFQYLQKAQVDDVVAKAYTSRESIVIVDPVQQQSTKRFITVMRPVEEVEEPSGAWTKEYIEPMFRPRGVTNKHLNVSSSGDLRWFGYILNRAHGRRPKFVPEPKESFKELKGSKTNTKTTPVSSSPIVGSPETGDLRSVTKQSIHSTESSKKASKKLSYKGSIKSGEMKLEALSASHHQNNDEEEWSPEGEQGSLDEEEIEGESEMEFDIKAEEEMEEEPLPAVVQGRKSDHHKKKKDKGLEKEKEKEKEKKEKEKDTKEKDAKKNKADKGKKGKRKESSMLAEEEQPSVDEEEMTDEEEEMEDVEQTPIFQSKLLRALSMDPEVGEYPQDIKDIKGVYELMEKERREGPRVAVMPHPPHCNAKKAVVVRSFLEIPQIDEKMQRTLLAASMSYADTVRTEVAMYDSYKQEDPRSAEEKIRQAGYKQEMIEKNIDEMHLLEQKPGPVLRFHF